MKQEVQASICCAAAMILVGSTVVASKLIAAGLPPFSASALRFAIALPVFLLLMRWRGATLPRLASISRGDWALLFSQAAAGSVGYSVLMIAGLRLSSAGDAGVMAGSLPAVSALMAVLVLGEALNWRLGAAIALASLGLLAVNGPEAVQAGSPAMASSSATDSLGRSLGHVMIFGAIVCEALFILLNKKLQKPQPALVLSTLMCAGGLLIALPFAAWEWPGYTTSDALLWPALGGVLYYALVPTVLGFVLWYAGAARLSSASAGLFTALLPVSALCCSAWVLGETISGRQVLGVLCVIGALVMVSLGQSQASPQSAMASDAN